MSRKKLSIVNQKSAAAEVAPEPDKIELKISERIAAATLFATKQKLEQDTAANQQQINALMAEIFERAGISTTSETPYTLTPEGLIKQ